VVKLPYQQGGLISLFHEAGQVERIEHGRGGVIMRGRIPGRLVAQFNNWHVAPNHHESEEEEEEL
jgi:GTP-binding protein HflX